MKRLDLQIGQKWSLIFLRISLGSSFLSAVADRFGLWGSFGAKNVSWGNFEEFQKYTASLNWFLPEAVIPLIAGIATVLEIVIGLFFILSIKLKGHLNYDPW